MRPVFLKQKIYSAEYKNYLMEALYLKKKQSRRSTMKMKAIT